MSPCDILVHDDREDCIFFDRSRTMLFVKANVNDLSILDDILFTLQAE